MDGVKSHIFLFNDIFLQSTLTKQKNVFKFKTVVDISYKLNVYETDKFRLVIDSDVTLEIVFETAEEKVCLPFYLFWSLLTMNTKTAEVALCFAAATSKVEEWSIRSTIGGIAQTVVCWLYPNVLL